MFRIYNKIIQISGDVIMVEAEDVGYMDIAEVISNRGVSLAQVIRLDGRRVYLQVFAGSRGISTSDKVRFLGHRLKVASGNNLLGRIFNAYGKPLDGGPALFDNLIEIGGPVVNPVKRVIPNKMIRTGIPMIDVFNSLVESQKIPIFSTPGEPHNELLARIAIQAEVDIIILGGMGIKYDDYLFFRDTLKEKAALSRAIFFIHTAADPSVECLLVPDISLAIAEDFALQNFRVLVLFSDMTNFSDALKEVSIIMEQIPSNRGYPGDLYSQLASRYEKAVDFDSAGSITILSITTLPGDDITHPVPDNTGYITEGQFYLKRGMIEPFGSLSRLRQNVNGKTREDHRAIMDTMIQLFAEYRKTLEKQSMGFQLSNWDKKLINYGKIFEEKMMSLEVNISLERALDLGWEILALCFSSEEIPIKKSLIEKFWHKNNYGKN